WEFVGSYWWLVFPLGAVFGGVAGGWAKAVRRWDERRRAHKLELARIKYGNRIQDAPEPGQAPAGGTAGSKHAARAEQASTRRTEMQRLVSEHDQIEQRWLSYELDLGKLIDYPVMSD